MLGTPPTNGSPAGPNGSSTTTKPPAAATATFLLPPGAQRATAARESNGNDAPSPRETTRDPPRDPRQHPHDPRAALMRLPSSAARNSATGVGPIPRPGAPASSSSAAAANRARLPSSAAAHANGARLGSPLDRAEPARASPALAPVASAPAPGPATVVTRDVDADAALESPAPQPHLLSSSSSDAEADADRARCTTADAESHPDDADPDVSDDHDPDAAPETQMLYFMANSAANSTVLGKYLPGHCFTCDRCLAASLPRPHRPCAYLARGRNCPYAQEKADAGNSLGIRVNLRTIGPACRAVLAASRYWGAVVAHAQGVAKRKGIREVVFTVTMCRGPCQRTLWIPARAEDQMLDDDKEVVQATPVPPRRAAGPSATATARPDPALESTRLSSPASASSHADRSSDHDAAASSSSSSDSDTSAPLLTRRRTRTSIAAAARSLSPTFAAAAAATANGGRSVVSDIDDDDDEDAPIRPPRPHKRARTKSAAPAVAGAAVVPAAIPAGVPVADEDAMAWVQSQLTISMAMIHNEMVRERYPLERRVCAGGRDLRLSASRANGMVWK
ncbi:hypothetical protein AMAG_15393 [Allomyces macrogynus ATCC 38327]|uniref:Uncharacterized protein n=1 Tax=Allomyces macrogynus (strain ATCC 38327) TaxID=578462 RepID=A0A0L0T7B6_ALLM3|nr:hypothetical protein AMAG_15393 [Allomyces macrogynus ATCC 38327]|eukprot:KNE70637.1 hypothetical protein AMAG_15393 [Allomyces macrogynus ATCC 38327]